MAVCICPRRACLEMMPSRAHAAPCAAHACGMHDTHLTRDCCRAGTTTHRAQFRGWQLPPHRAALGIATVGDAFLPIIPAAAKAPCSIKQARARMTLTFTANTLGSVGP